MDVVGRGAKSGVVAATIAGLYGRAARDQQQAHTFHTHCGQSELCMQQGGGGGIKKALKNKTGSFMKKTLKLR